MVTTTTLKNAARAIGYDLWSDPDGSHYLVDYDGVKLKRWDPERDDGDALRLAVMLDIHILFFASMTTTRELLSTKSFDERHDVDAFAATRLAIIRAAAEIGAAL